MNQATAEHAVSSRATIAAVPKEAKSATLPSRIWLVISPFLPLLFVTGWFLYRRFFSYDDRFLLTSMLATLATIALVVVLRRPIEGMWPLVIFLAIFLVGYYLKFYWLAARLDEDDVQTVFRFFRPYYSQMYFPLLRRENLLRTFELSTWGYVTFCVAAVAAVGLRMVPRSVRRIDLPGSAAVLNKAKILCGLYLVLGFGIWLGTSFLIRWLGIGIHGAESVRLPFKLTGLINYLGGLPPILFLFAAAWSDRKGMRTYWWLSMLGIAAFAIGVILLQASRGALVAAVVIPLGTLWLVMRRFTPTRVSLLIVLFLATMLLRPALTAYRELRANPFSNQGMTEIMAQALQSSDTGALADDFMRVAMRVIGVDSVLYVASIEPEVEGSRLASTLLAQHSLSSEFTHDVGGFPQEITVHYMAPSLVGGIYYLAGMPGIIGGIFIIVLAIQWLWGRLYRSRWWTTPVALVQVAGWAFFIGTEGTFDVAMRNAFVTIMFMVGLEFVSRIKLEVRNPQRG